METGRWCVFYHWEHDAHSERLFGVRGYLLRGFAPTLITGWSHEVEAFRAGRGWATFEAAVATFDDGWVTAVSWRRLS